MSWMNRPKTLACKTEAQKVCVPGDESSTINASVPRRQRAQSPDQKFPAELPLAPSLAGDTSTSATSITCNGRAIPLLQRGGCHSFVTCDRAPTAENLESPKFLAVERLQRGITDAGVPTLRDSVGFYDWGRASFFGSKNFDLSLPSSFPRILIHLLPPPNSSTVYSIITAFPFLSARHLLFPPSPFVIPTHNQAR